MPTPALPGRPASSTGIRWRLAACSRKMVPGRRRGADLRHRRDGMEPDLHRRWQQGMDPRAGCQASHGAAGRGEDRGLQGTGAGFLQALRRRLPGRRHGPGSLVAFDKSPG